MCIHRVPSHIYTCVLAKHCIAETRETSEQEKEIKRPIGKKREDMDGKNAKRKETMKGER